jgi:D-glycero-beta-D-manno-heptose 1-phosphate adenylyltransferase
MHPIKFIEQKIIAPGAIAALAHQWRAEEENIVFTNGCFDLIHRGHIDYLAKAAGLGTKLVIGLNSDDSVRRLKGSPRPYQDEISRGMILAALFFTDAVVLFGEDTPYNLIREVMPDILVKGSDYVAEEIVGYDIVTGHGGKVMTLDYLPGYSTTSIVERIQSK